MGSISRLHELLYRYFNGNASADETNELMQLIDQSRNDEALSDALKQIWDELSTEDPVFSQNDFQRMFDGIVKPEAEEITIGKRGKIWSFPLLRVAAAAIIVMLGIGIFYQSRQKQLVRPVAAVFADTTITPGGNRAILTLADGTSIRLDTARNGLLAQQGSTEVTKTEEGQLEYEQKGKSAGQLSQQINTISTPRGGQYHVVLPDGSEVWLNAASSIRFPAQFAGNERRVSITGEVYFDVKKNPASPFKVQFTGSEVEVLGTSFNIMAYPGETSTQTTLLEGAVKLKSGTTTKKLKPGEQGAVSNNGQVEVQLIDTEEVTAWKQGLFYFKDADVSTVMKQVARWYDIDVRFEEKTAGKRQPQKLFTGKVARDIKISQLLDLLQYIGVDYKISGREVTILR